MSEGLKELDFRTYTAALTEQASKYAQRVREALRGMNYAVADAELGKAIDEIDRLSYYVSKARDEETKAKDREVAQKVVSQRSQRELTVKAPDLREFYPENQYEKAYDMTLEGDFAVYRIPVTPQIYWVWPKIWSDYDTLVATKPDGSEWMFLKNYHVIWSEDQGEYGILNMTYPPNTNSGKCVKIQVGSELAKAWDFEPPQFIDIKTSLFRIQATGTHFYSWSGFLGKRVTSSQGYDWKTRS